MTVYPATFAAQLPLVYDVVQRLPQGGIDALGCAVAAGVQAHVHTGVFEHGEIFLPRKLWQTLVLKKITKPKVVICSCIPR